MPRRGAIKVEFKEKSSPDRERARTKSSENLVSKKVKVSPRLARRIEREIQDI